MSRLPFALALLALPLSTMSATAEMRLTSSDFAEGGVLSAKQVMSEFGCTGENLSPELSWTGSPDGTGSFIISVYDPDAPTGSGLWHWSVINIPAETTALPEGAGDASGANLPIGAVQVRNDLSQNAYSGACPPQGAKPHRYVFSVFAMPDQTVPLDANASAAMVGFYANTQALARATLTATYGR